MNDLDRNAKTEISLGVLFVLTFKNIEKRI